MENSKRSKEERIERLIAYLPTLSEGQIVWVERIVVQFSQPKTYKRINDSDIIINEAILEDFGDALRIHHCFTDEPFTKDKFEYVLVNVSQFYGLISKKNTNNTPGADVIIGQYKYSLKTQADKNLREGFINIHKFMELGKGAWTDRIEHLTGLTTQFLNHLENYDRILVLRNIGKPTL